MNLQETLELINRVRQAPVEVKQLLLNGLREELHAVPRYTLPYSKGDRVKRIIKAIQQNPGCTRQELQAMLRIPKSSLGKHLQALRASNQVNAVKVGKSFAYRLKAVKPSKQRIYRSVYARMDKVEKYLKEAGSATRQDIARDLGIPPTTLWPTLKELAKKSPHVKCVGLRPILYCYDELKK